MRAILLLLITTFSLLSAKNIAFLVDTGTAHGLHGERDIETLKELLGDKYKYIILSAEEATTQNIVDKFQQLAKELNQKDTLIFYYTGHGDRFQSGNHKEEQDKKNDFLVPADIKISPKHQPNEYRITNVIMDNQLNYLYAQIEAKKIIIIDACHSASMNKSISLNSHEKIKTYRPEHKLYRTFPLQKRWLESRNSNFLHFGAAKEEESAIDTPQGGKFTLAIRDIIREKGNISFAKLEKLVNERLDDTFHPSISNDSTIDKRSLYTKDIFVIPHTSAPTTTNLQTLLERDLEAITVQTQSNQNSFRVGDQIAIKGYLSEKPNYLYLIELKENNSYKLISYNQSSIYVKERQKYMVQFINLKITKPLGKSSIYILSTKEPLPIDKKDKDSIISQDYFDNSNSLFESLKHQKFKAGKIEINSRM